MFFDTIIDIEYSCINMYTNPTLILTSVDEPYDKKNPQIINFQKNIYLVKLDDTLAMCKVGFAIHI